MKHAYRINVCDNFLNLIAKDTKLIGQSLNLCLKKHNDYVTALNAYSKDRSPQHQEFLENVVNINETVFKKLLVKIKELKLSFTDDELLTSNTAYAILMEESGLSSKRKLDLEKLKDLLNKELLRTARSAKEASVLKDYLISVGDTFIESFPDPKVAKEWLESNFDKIVLKNKGMTPFKLASYILEDSTLLIGGAVTSMSPHIASLSEFVSTEGAMVMPAIFAGLASLGALCKGVEAKLTDNAAEKWAAKEKEETMNMTPEELKARKEKVGANILLAREKALANEEKAEATSRKVAAVGTFIALSS